MRITWPFFSRYAWMAGSHPRNWVVVRSPTRFGSIGSAASMKAIEPSGGPGRSKKKTRLYRRCGIGACPRWTMRSTGMSATSHAPNEGSAETRHVTPAFASISCASSTAFVRKPTGNCRPTVFEFRPRITSRSRSVSPMDLDRHADARKKMSLGVLALFAFDLEPPRRRKFRATFPECSAAALVLRAGVRLAATFAMNASGFASHGPRGARRSERYLLLGGGGRFRCGRKRDPGGLAPSRPSSENHQEAQDGHGRSADQGG